MAGGYIMNNGNHIHNIVSTTRTHTTPKKILSHDSQMLYLILNPQDGPSALKDVKDIEGMRSFFRYIDDFESATQANAYMTNGKWKLLFSFIRKLATHHNVNYCVYQNPYGILFDVTLHDASFEESLLLQSQGQPAKETDVEKLQRYKDERDQIEIKIKHLQAKKAETQEKITELLQSFLGDSFTDILGIAT